jgi:hypothetical protein
VSEHDRRAYFRIVPMQLAEAQRIPTASPTREMAFRYPLRPAPTPKLRCDDTDYSIVVRNWESSPNHLSVGVLLGQYSDLFRTRRTLKGREGMRIHVGCELSFEFPQTTFMITTVKRALLARFRTRASGLSDNDSFGSY